MNTVSLIGMGALGILFGQPLSASLEEGQFRIIADSDRIRRYSQSPILCNGNPCHFHFISPGDTSVPPADLVMVAVKSTALHQAMEDMASQVGPDTVIISLLNGISSEELLEERWPGQVVYAISIGMDATRVGQSLVYKNMGRIQIGERDGSTSPRLLALCQLFQRGNVPYELREDILLQQWNKMVVNVGLNQATAVFDVPYGGIQREGEARDATIAAMWELIHVANARGIALGQAHMDGWLAMFPSFLPEGMPSMRQDVLAQRPTEVELFSGTVCRLGRELDIPTPVNDWFYEKIQEIEAGYTKTP